MTWNGLLRRPRLHLGFGNRFGVHISRPRQMRPYAAALGTPAAETREVKATLEARIVQVMIAATAQTTMTALRGWPFFTRDTQPENGRTPSRATAKTSREAATIAMAVFYREVSCRTTVEGRCLTSHNAVMQMMFMNIWPPFPSTTAYSGTNGCGDPNSNSFCGEG